MVIMTSKSKLIKSEMMTSLMTLPRWVLDLFSEALLVVTTRVIRNIFFNVIFQNESDISDKYGNGEWPYFGLKPRIFSYSTPEFTLNDLMPKYAFQQAQFELEFNKIDNEWVSIQTILDQVFFVVS